MGFPRQESWSGLPYPHPRDLPNPEIEPASFMSPALAGRFFTTSTTQEADMCIHTHTHTHTHVVCCLVVKSCPTLFDPMNCSTPCLPVHHQLPEFTQTHVIKSVMPSAISSSVVPFSSCPQSLPASESFPTSQLFT